MIRPSHFFALLALALLAACGKGGEIAPPDGRVEDPRIRAFRAEEEKRIESERAQYRITEPIEAGASESDYWEEIDRKDEEQEPDEPPPSEPDGPTR